MKRFNEYMSESNVESLPQLRAKVKGTFKGYGLKHTERQIDKLIDLTRFQLDSRPFPAVTDVVFPAGSGKSTYLIDNVQFVGNDLNGVVGGFVLKSKRSEVEEFCEAVNSGWNKQVAYPFLPPQELGVDKDILTQIEEQKDFPFICMTWEKFKRMNISGELSRVNKYNANGEMNKRSLVLIDEMPSLNGTFTFTLRDVLKIEETVYYLKGKKKISEMEAKVMLNGCTALKESLYELPEGAEINSRIAPAFKVPKSVRKNWTNKSNLLEDVERLTLFEKAIQNRTKHHTTPNGDVSLVVHTPVSLPTSDYKVIVFDASSNIDPNIPLSWEIISFNFKGNEYRNMTVVTVTGETFSKQAMGKIKSLIPDTASMIKLLWLKECETFTHKVITITTHKDYVNKLKKEVLALFEGEEVTIYFKHFDGGRGSNSFADSTLIFQVGAFTTNDSVYAVQATAHEHIESVKQRANERGLNFEDEDLQDYFERATATSIYQEVQRGRAYDSEIPKVAYILGNNTETIKKATREFTENGARTKSINSRVEKWFTHRLKPEFTQTEEKLLKVARQMNEHSKMTKGDFVEQVGCSTETLKKALRKDSFKEAMNETGVTFSKKTVIKTEPVLEEMSA